VYGGQPEWERNFEAGRLASSEIERAVSKLEKEANAEFVGSLSLLKKKAQEPSSPKPLDINRFFGCGDRILTCDLWVMSVALLVLQNLGDSSGDSLFRHSMQFGASRCD
jgi:hypothetical protein